MTLFVILEGQKGAGKSHIGLMLKQQLEEQQYNVAFFDEEGIIKECLNDGKLMIYDLYGIREQEYLYLLKNNDIIIIEKSFITNVIYHLHDMPQHIIQDFIEYELGHYYNEKHICQIYTLFRNYEDTDVDIFLNLSHYLLETYSIDISCLPNSRDDNTETLLNHMMTKIEMEVA